MGDDYLLFLALITLMGYQVTVLSGHLQAVNHHQRTDFSRQPASAQGKQILHVRVFEIQFSVEFVVFFVEGPARDKDSDSHNAAFWKMKLVNHTILSSVFAGVFFSAHFFIVNFLCM
jgi:hypothetical protein